MDTERLMWKLLTDYCCYKEGEKVGVIEQLMPVSCPQKFANEFDFSRKFNEVLLSVYKSKNVPVTYLTYTPKELRNGVDVPKEIYDLIGNQDIIIMATAFSLTHTAFRKAQTDKGTRVASMPGFTLEMLATLDSDPTEMRELTETVWTKLYNSTVVDVKGHKTDIRIEIDPTLVDQSLAFLDAPGKCENIPGAEVYVVPKHCGNSKGYFTVPKGFGGDLPLPCDATFTVNQGRIVDIQYDQVHKAFFEEHVLSLFKGENFNILAELGIGTNPAITTEYIKKHGWSTLIGEKIYGSAHFANGNSKGMGGENDVPVHVDWVVPDVKIEFIKKLS
jgi:leucyl aminopeptidase (aminopeptidase T)